MTRAPLARMTSSDVLGQWHVRVGNVNVTMFRGAPSTISSLTDTDPFGPASASLQFPQISPLETVGAPGSDTQWIQPDSPVEIVWQTTDKRTVQVLGKRFGLPMRHMWCGYLVDVSRSTGEGLRIECQGALRRLDHVLAKPATPRQPWPYEWAIWRAVNQASEALGRNRYGSIGTMDPYHYEDAWWWDVRFNPTTYSQPYLLPKGLAQGDKWSGLVTRELGQWDETMTSYVSNMLTGMWTPQGRVTIDLHPNSWRPRMRHAYAADFIPVQQVMRVDAAWPGVNFDLSVDYTQTANVLYGKVESTWAGLEFTNEVRGPDGANLGYRPFAKGPELSGSRKEMFLDFPQGLTTKQAYEVAGEHLSKVAGPGVAGTITLTGVDPVIREFDEIQWDIAREANLENVETAGGEWVQAPKQVIRPGMALRLDGFNGMRPGQLLYISETNHNVESNSVSLTVDSKSRDYQTVNEVLERGRDSLRISHTMTVGQYTPGMPDMLLPWNYDLGSSLSGVENQPPSGLIPYRSAQLWRMWVDEQGGRAVQFPWYELTRKYPPKKFREAYITIRGDETFHRGFKKPNGTIKYGETRNFWSVVDGKGGRQMFRYDPQVEDDSHCGVFLSAAGTSKGIEIVCVDRNGEPLPVSFGLYLMRWRSIGGKGRLKPQTPSPNNTVRPLAIPYDGEGRHYKSEQYYPFAPYIFSDTAEDGKRPFYSNPEAGQSSDGERIIGYGNYWERPGYWPLSLQDPGATPNGVFRDDGSFDWNFNDVLLPNKVYRDIDDYVLYGGATAMIFCDDMPTVSKYFIGRIYRQEVS